jgi:hypothetical protein
MEPGPNSFNSIGFGRITEVAQSTIANFNTAIELTVDNSFNTSVVAELFTVDFLRTKCSEPWIQNTGCSCFCNYE